MDAIEKYLVRDIEVSGFSGISHFIDYLFAYGRVRTGALVAINAEKVITAEQDKSLKQMIEAAEYKYADGISIVWAIRRKYPQVQVARIAGADLWEALMIKAGQENIPVFIVGGKATVLAETVAKLRQLWQVNIVGCQNGFFQAEEREALFTQIRASGAKIVTVAMGSPKQERFIHDCRDVAPDILYMGVGGTYDVFIGQVKRAPKLWQRWGLEWLYRLLTQPTRWRRQLNLLKFLSYYYTNRL